MNPGDSLRIRISGGEDLSKKTDEETGMEIEKASESKQINVAEEFERVTAIVGKVRDAIVTLKDSNVKIKDWHFAIDKTGKEYDVEFTLKLNVTPKEDTAT